MSAPALLAPNVVIDRGVTRIVVDALVGEGAMGVVWRAWLFHPPGKSPPQPPQPLALKVLRDRPTRETRDLFVREAEALRRLSHPNAVAYYDFFEHMGSLVLATEYVDGETLESIIERQRNRHGIAVQPSGAAAPGLPCMPFLRAWYYCQQLLGALAAVHAFGMVHRDVKPSNTLVRRDGLVKLGDFGITRIHGAATLATSRAFSPGTGPYMSPEQVLSRPLDGRSDLYSAAIVLFEMLTGETPFSPERGELMVRQDQVETPPPPIRTFLPQAPPVLDSLFARALAKDPAARFDNAIAMGEAFRTALGIAESPEWRAQADIARTAKTIADLRAIPSLAVENAQQAKLTTLREFVVERYKTMKLASL